MGVLTDDNKSVTLLLQSFTSDLAGAHRAWYGLSPIERKAFEVEEKRRLETERRAKEVRRVKEEKMEVEKKEKKEAESKAREEAVQQRRVEEKTMVMETAFKSFKTSTQKKTGNKNKIKGKTH